MSFTFPSRMVQGALVLGLAAASLTACTADPQSGPAAPSRNVTLRLAAPADATGTALGHVYANALEHLGYTVQLTDSPDEPYRQLADGKADLAIDTAPHALGLMPQGADPRGEDQLLSRDEAAGLVAQINDAQLGYTAAPVTEADTGNVVALSGAEAVEDKISSVATLAAACTQVRFVAAQAPGPGLLDALEKDGCDAPKFTTVPANRLAAQLRTATDEVVVLSGADAVIGDEGFATVQGSDRLFDAAPYLPLLGGAVDEDAARQVRDVTAQVTQQALIGLNRMVSGPDDIDPPTAANRWQWIIEN